MRSFDPGFAAHIATGATTLASCWTITRGDGVVLGFTDHDETLSFGGQDYIPANGLDGSGQSQALGAKIDTSEVTGVLSSDAIDEDDILLGRYDGATVETWRVNWRDVSQRALLSRTTIGEITREDGAFRAELRSGQQALNQVRGRIYSSFCDATLGDTRCGIDLSNPLYSATATVTGVRDRNRVVVSGLAAFDVGWFTLGRASWTSGARDGLKDPILAHSREGTADILTFSAPVGDRVVIGDTVTVSAGCDRQFSTCRDRFANVADFRGFPHIPGNDFVLSYPRSGDPLDGAPLFT